MDPGGNLMRTPKNIDAEALVTGLALEVAKELRAVRDRLAEAEAELSRLRRKIEAEQ
jgi:hypothetical protein